MGGGRLKKSHYVVPHPARKKKMEMFNLEGILHQKICL